MSKHFEHFFKRCVELAGNCQFKEQPTAADWRQLEHEIGRRIPPDHQRFVSYFGSGTFGDDLYLLNPRASGRCRFDALRLEQNREEKRLLLEDVGCDTYPKTNLLLIAFTTSRMDLLLDVKDQSGDQLMFLDLGQMAQVPLQMSAAEFVYKLYLGEFDEQWSAGVRRSIWVERETPFFRPFSTG